MYKLIFLLIVAPLFVFAQNGQRDVKLINSFIKDAIVRKNNFNLISDKYYHFEDIKGRETVPVTMEERQSMMKILTDSLVQKNRTAITKDGYTIVPYETVKLETMKFDNTDHIYAVLSKNIPLFYVYVINNKIESFTYILKGDAGYFITI